MRRFALSLAAFLVLLAAGAFTPGTANAMALSTPAGIQAAIDDTNLVEDVRYVCRRVRACGPFGCTWRRSCYWTGGGGGWRGHRRHRGHRRW